MPEPEFGLPAVESGLRCVSQRCRQVPSRVLSATPEWNRGPSVQLRVCANGQHLAGALNAIIRAGYKTIVVTVDD